MMDQRQVIPAGGSVILLRNGIPGLGGLNRFYLDENGYIGGSVPVTQDITRNAGQVQLPNGTLLDVTIRDVQ